MHRLILLPGKPMTGLPYGIFILIIGNIMKIMDGTIPMEAMITAAGTAAWKEIRIIRKFWIFVGNL